MSRPIDSDSGSRPAGGSSVEGPSLEGVAERGLARLEHDDPELYGLLTSELRRQHDTLVMVAAGSMADPSVLGCLGTAAANVTTEGYPGQRFHAGCRWVDDIERLAVERACEAFSARYANVQPHSGTSANQIVLFQLLDPGDTLLGLALDSGGHLTHGSKASVSGRYFDAVAYHVGDDGRLDYRAIRRLAAEHRPRLIICGASAYPREIDFARFREIADEVGAYLLADVSHIAGLIVAGRHPSPIDHAHFTTTSTYKQLFGPRGGLILMGRDFEREAPDGRGTLAEMMQRAAFPYFQGTPNLGAIAAKARALAWSSEPGFDALAGRIVDGAAALAAALAERRYEVVTGGTDNHIVLLDLRGTGLTGLIAERALETCGLIVNRNKIPGDPRPPTVTSGLRFGTNTLAFRGFEADDMSELAGLVDRVLTELEPQDDSQFELAGDTRRAVRRQVRELCARFPLPAY